MLFGAPISMYDFWVGNQLPVTIGNFLGGAVINGTLWYYAHLRNYAAHVTIRGAGRCAPGRSIPPADQLLRISVTDRSRVLANSRCAAALNAAQPKSGREP